MASSQRHRLSASLLLLLLSLLPTLSSEAMTSNVSGPRDNSLARFSSKSTSSAAAKDRKSAGIVVVEGSTSAARAQSLIVPWTPACRNDSCPASETDPGVQESERTPSQHPDGDRPAADNVERRDVIRLMRSVSEELSGLRTALQHLRVDSQAVHRQIRRLHRASCTAARRARRRTKWTGNSEKNKHPSDNGI